VWNECFVSEVEVIVCDGGLLIYNVIMSVLWTPICVLVCVLLSFISVTDAQALTPPNFNLAVGRKVEATSTCGVGVTEPELYCKLTGANPDKEDVIGEFEVIQGQLCDYCDSRQPSQSHQAEYAVDGTERWWQSPPLSRGLQFNEVNLTISLGQVTRSPVHWHNPHLTLAFLFLFSILHEKRRL